MSNILKGLNEGYFSRDEENQQNAMNARRSSDLGSERNAGLDEPDDFSSEPVQTRNGVYEYTVPAGQESIAQELGLQQHRGHWVSRMPIQRANFQFGRPQFHEIPSQGMAEAEGHKADLRFMTKKQREMRNAKIAKMERDGYVYNSKTKTWQKPKQGVAEGKDEKIAQLKKDYATAVHWSENERSPQKREEYRRKALKIKNHLEKQYKQGVAEATGDAKFDTMMGNIAKPSAVKALGREEKVHELIRKYFWHKRRSDQGSAVTGEHGHDRMAQKMLMALKKMNVDLSTMDPSKLKAIKGEVYEQGVAEGSLEEQVYKVVALDKSNALAKPVKLKVKASSIEDVFSRLAANDWYALSINGVEVVAGKRLKQGVAEGWKQKVGAGLTAAAMATGAGGVVLNPARPIGPKGQTVANPYKATNTKPAEDDAWKKIEKRKAAEKKGVAEGLEDKVVFKGHTIGHIETDSDGDPVGIVYSNNPQSKRPFEIYGYEDVNQLKQEMISQWNKRVPKGVAEEKQRLDPSCWKGYKKQGTKMKGDTRVNNCVPIKKESAIMKGLK